MNDVMIFDGKGYWVGRRRPDGRCVDLWSPRKEDAARFHFRQVAEKIASTLPQRVRIVSA